MGELIEGEDFKIPDGAGVALNLDQAIEPSSLVITFKRPDHLVRIEVYQDDETSDIINTISIVPETPDTPSRTCMFSASENGTLNIEF